MRSDNPAAAIGNIPVFLSGRPEIFVVKIILLEQFAVLQQNLRAFWQAPFFIQKKRTTSNGSAFYKFFNHIASC